MPAPVVVVSARAGSRSAGDQGIGLPRTGDGAPGSVRDREGGDRPDIGRDREGGDRPDIGRGPGIARGPGNARGPGIPRGPGTARGRRRGHGRDTGRAGTVAVARRDDRRRASPLVDRTVADADGGPPSRVGPAGVMVAGGRHAVGRRRAAQPAADDHGVVGHRVVGHRVVGQHDVARPVGGIAPCRRQAPADLRPSAASGPAVPARRAADRSSPCRSDASGPRAADQPRVV